jgi:hypothetical protein
MWVRTGNWRSVFAFISCGRHRSFFVRSPMVHFVQSNARLLDAHRGDAPALTELIDYFRIVLRTSRSPADAPAADAPTADAPTADAPTADAPAPRHVDPPPIQTSSGTPVAVPHTRSVRSLRRVKLVKALQPGDAICLETGVRVVVTYVSAGRAPSHRYIEWRGPLPNNWANLPLDALVVTKRKAVKKSR